MPIPQLLKNLWFILVLLGSNVCLSQNTTALSGKILDSFNLQPLSGVFVSIQNENITFVTDDSGMFYGSDIVAGSYLVQIKHQGYDTQTLTIQIKKNEVTNLQSILLVKSSVAEASSQIITLSADELVPNEEENTSSVVMLHSQMDAFQKAAAFNFSPFRFKNRGLDGAYATVLINGTVMNKLYNGRPQWSNWGGLNDITRNFDFSIGSQPAETTFGSVNGTQNISTRVSDFVPQSKVSFASSNTHYNYRAMGTHATGLSDNGWGLLVSASKRWADEGYVSGTSYLAHSLLLGVEKRFNAMHSLNLTAVLTPNERGKNSYNSDEITALTSTKYNAYWGYQGTQKRNSRMQKNIEPILFINHYWNISPKTSIQNNISIQSGKTSNSRLDYTSANNPNPNYYKYLPSYYLNNYNDNTYAPDYQQADQALQYFLNHQQINWDQLYTTNQLNGESVYAIVSDVTQDTSVQYNAILHTEITPHIRLQSNFTYRNLQSFNFGQLTDLLGGLYFADVDPFLTGNQAQSNLLTPNRNVFENQKLGYNYQVTAHVADAFAQLQFNYAHWDMYWSQKYNHTQYQRNGFYQNGNYPHASLGKSSVVTFDNLSSKIGVTYKPNGIHQYQVNLAHINQAPVLRNVFSNPRINNHLIPNLKNEVITSFDVNYHYHSPTIKSRVTPYFSQIKNNTSVSYYYTEGLGIITPNTNSNYTNPNAFVTEITTGIEKKKLGYRSFFRI